LQEQYDQANNEKKGLNTRIETLREEVQEGSNEIMKLKLDFGMKEALMSQQIDFDKRKIDELMTQLNDSNMSLSEKLEL
jgi:predicted  nucleic acid-binding Zn-ribbon protein